MQTAPEISFPDKGISDIALDHQVDVNPLTGAAVVSVPLPLTPGRSGFGPSLALNYSSSAGNSVFGVGWSLSGLPSIGLSSKRLPRYEGDDQFVFNGSDELVPVLELAEGTWEPVVHDENPDYRIYYYRSKVEQDYTRFEKWVHRESGRIHWRARGPDNSVAIFGYDESDDSRIQDSDNPSRTYQWLIETQYDANGNAIRYEYRPENWDNVNISNSYEQQRLLSGKGFTQRYLMRILYGNTHPLSAVTPTTDDNRWLFQVVFDYGDHNDAPWPSHEPSDGYEWPARSDPFSSHRPGFEVRTHRLCRRVLMFHHFDQLGQRPAPVGAVTLIHAEEPAGTTLEQIGYTGYRTDIQTREITSRSIPSLSFIYSQPDMGRHFQPISETAALNLPQGLSGLNYRWMDLYGEGLPGILTETNQAWYYKPNQGEGQFGHQTLVAQKPSNLVGSYALSDFDSDGNPNLVMFAGRQAGYCEYDRDQDQWQGYRPFPCAPVLEETGTSAQWIDLNGDGRSDIIISKQDRFTWYPSEGKEGFGAPVEFANPGVEHAAQAPAIEEDLRLNTLFADMSGDGLLDRVRIRNGRVEYWPQLGNGRFGDAIVMENAPSFDFENQFDLGRLRLADLDGSGTADLIYLGRGEITYWINAGGNCFLQGVRISGLPYIDNLSSAQVLDFLGDGTPCLVWSSPLNSQAHAPLQYLPLTNGIQPRLLLSVDNAMGKRIDLTYSNSGRHYLRDNLAGRPWISKLPNHATVVDRMDVWDQIGNTRFCSRYEYHDGFFDSGEREFRGFGQVDRYDSENFDSSADMAEDRFTDPACIRTFYHNGAFGWDERRRQSYYQGDPDHALLPEPAFHQQLDFFGKTFEDGFRALAGRMLRQEIFAVDRDGQRAEHPFQVTQNTYRIRQLQPAREEDDACFDVFLSETLVHEYEQDPDDPRVTHDLTLDVDPYGNVKRTCAIAYPRREAIADALEDQRRSYLSVATNEFAEFNEIGRLETGIPLESKAYALAWPETISDSLLDYDTVVRGVSDALENPLAVDEDLPQQPEASQARLIQWQRFFYWDADTSAALPHGGVGPQTLLHHQETACFTDSLVESAFESDSEIDIPVDAAMLETQARYRFQEGYWWQPGSTLHYGTADTFFSLDRLVRLDDGTTQYDYDNYLTLVSVADAVGNLTRADIDYNLVAPWQITDPNGTVAEVRYDPLCMIVVATTQGTVMGTSGTSAPYGHDRLTGYTPLSAEETNTAAIIANPARFIQNAGQFLHYDLAVTPPVSISLVREQWVHDGSGRPSGESPIQVQLTYLDGFGRTLQSKQRVEEGPAIQRNDTGDVMLDTQGRPLEVDSIERWRVSGHTVYNNKQLPVRQYEPFFSTLTRFEGDEELQTFGVSTLSHYDALGRLVETELPNGTLTRVETTPWETRNFDPNDTIEGSPYAVLHELLPDSDPERQAYENSLDHDHTPTIIRRDPLGRDIEQEKTSNEHPHRITRTSLDILGNTTEIIDPRGLSAFAYQHDMLGRVLHEHSMDAGDKWMLADAMDQPLHLWDGLGVHQQFFHDSLGRPTDVHVEAHTEKLELDHITEHMVYGDDPAVTYGAAHNARGRLVEHYDQAGLITIRQYAPDGNVLHAERRLVPLTADDYHTEPDWRDPTPDQLEAPFTTRNAFDALGRVTEQSLPDGTTRAFRYLPSGGVNRVLVSTGDGEWTERPFLNGCVYNARGQRTEARLRLEDVESEERWIKIAYSYDPNTFRLVNILSTHDRNEGPIRTYQDIDYTYDPVGNITCQEDHIQDPTARTPVLHGLPNALSPRCDYIYDAFYQLCTATGRVHQALLQHDYRANNNSDSHLKGTRHLHLNNAVAVERYTRTYSYDVSGNIEFIHHGSSTRTWNTEIRTSDTSNRSLPAQDLNSVDILNIEDHFDPNGNCEYMPHLREIVWNYRNNIATAVIIERPEREGGNDVEYYVYGGDGMRVRKLYRQRVPSSGPDRLYDIKVTEKIYLDGCEIKRIHRNDTLELDQATSHITDGADRIAMLQQSPGCNNGPTEKQFRYQLSNHLGSSMLEVSKYGEVITYEEYFPYGGTAFIGGDQREVRFKDYRYSGKERDDGTGFYYYGFRYYAAWIGNWLSPDPIGPEDSVNLYQFVRNNPVNSMDPLGLNCGRCIPPRRGYSRRGGGTTLGDIREHLGERYTPMPPSILLRHDAPIEERQPPARGDAMTGTLGRTQNIRSQRVVSDRALQAQPTSPPPRGNSTAGTQGSSLVVEALQQDQQGRQSMRQQRTQPSPQVPTPNTILPDFSLGRRNYANYLQNRQEDSVRLDRGEPIPEQSIPATSGSMTGNLGEENTVEGFHAAEQDRMRLDKSEPAQSEGEQRSGRVVTSGEYQFFDPDPEPIRPELDTERVLGAALAGIGIGAALIAVVVCVPQAGVPLLLAGLAYSAGMRVQENIDAGNTGPTDILSAVVLSVVDISILPRLFEGIEGESILTGRRLSNSEREVYIGGSLGAALTLLGSLGAGRLTRISNNRVDYNYSQGNQGGNSPHTPGLPERVSMEYLQETGALPGYRGVAITDRGIRFADLFKLSTREGINVEFSWEFVRETGELMVYSGGPGRVRAGTGHTHPRGLLIESDRLPSRQDIRVLDSKYERLNANPATRRQAEKLHGWIIWSGDPGTEATVYYPSNR